MLRSTIALCALILVGSANATVESQLTQVAGVEVRCPSPWPRAGLLGTYDEPTQAINLAPRLCRTLARDLAGQYGKRPDASAKAWSAFAHELAHHRGYDHGEHTLGADCVGERIDAGLMRKAGLPRGYIRRVDRAITWGCNHPSTGSCSIDSSPAFCAATPVESTVVLIGARDA